MVVLDLETARQNLLTFQVKRALLARMAREIAGLLTPAGAAGVRARGRAPPVRPGDIYVLTRTTRESREVGDALRAARVPFAYFKQEKLFQTIEAREVLDLLRAIADPDDATARARAFITPFFGLGLVDLAACDDLDDSHALLRTLYEWRGLAESGDFETLFARIVDDSGIVCRELFFRDSERSLTNYLHLLEILQEEAARVAGHHPRAVPDPGRLHPRHPPPAGRRPRHPAAGDRRRRGADHDHPPRQGPGGAGGVPVRRASGPAPDQRRAGDLHDARTRVAPAGWCGWAASQRPSRSATTPSRTTRSAGCCTSR